MSNKRNCLKHLFLISLIILIFASCSPSSNGISETASLLVEAHQKGISVASIAPTTPEPVKYVISLIQGDNTQSWEFEPEEIKSGSVQIDDIKVGTYDLYIAGYSLYEEGEDGQKIQVVEGSNPVIIKPNTSNIAVITLSYLSTGTGTISLKIDWSSLTQKGNLISDALDRKSIGFLAFYADDDDNSSNDLAVCGNPTEETLANKIKWAESEDFTNKFIEYIALSLIDFKGTAEFPDDSNVINSIIEKDVYKTVLSKFILTRLEHLNSKEKIDIENITIEHIMPRTLNDDWKDLIGNNYKEIHKKYINTLGNLTLTGYNSELSNNNLKDKIKVYKNSKFTFLNKDLLKLNDWNESIIIERSKRLINELLKYYKYPDIKVNETDDILEYPLDDSIDFSGMNIYSFEYRNNKYDVTKWAGFLTKILNLIYEDDSVQFSQMIFQDDVFKNKISDEEFFYNYGKASKTESNFFVNTDTDTNTKIKLLISVLDKLNISTDEITLYIKKK